MEEKDINKILEECKTLKKKIYKNISFNIIILFLEIICILNVFEIKKTGFIFLPKLFCLIILVFASMIGIKALISIIKYVKHYFVMQIIQEALENMNNQ